MNTRTTAVTILLLVLWFGSTPSKSEAGRVIPPPRAKLTSYNWSVSGSPNLARHPPPKRVIEEFVRAIENAVFHESYIGDGEEICSYAFANLRHNGYLSLVYGTGVLDRPSCREIYIIDRTASGFEMHGGGGPIGSGSGIPGKIVDLGHDGKSELLLDYTLGSVGNHVFDQIYVQGCIANWTVVYAWTGANYTSLSERFKAFYRQALNRINRVIPTLQPARDSNGYALSDKPCLEAEAAAIQRFLGTSSDAGIDQAEHLATSADPAERQFAAELLYWIDTPKAREDLVKLAKDQDSRVATLAKRLSKPVSGGVQALGGGLTPY